jgi:hypothetical protein
MSIQELELVKLMIEIDPTTTVKEVSKLLKELRKGRNNERME